MSSGGVEQCNLLVVGLEEGGDLRGTGQVGEGSHDVGPHWFLLFAWEREQEEGV